MSNFLVFFEYFFNAFISGSKQRKKHQEKRLKSAEDFFRALGLQVSSPLKYCRFGIGSVVVDGKKRKLTISANYRVRSSGIQSSTYYSLDKQLIPFSKFQDVLRQNGFTIER